MLVISLLQNFYLKNGLYRYIYFPHEVKLDGGSAGCNVIGSADKFNHYCCQLRGKPEALK
jgi:hypothetical protein